MYIHIKINYMYLIKYVLANCLFFLLCFCCCYFSFFVPHCMKSLQFASLSPVHKMHRLQGNAIGAMVVPLKKFLLGVLIGFLFFFVLRHFYAAFYVAKFALPRHNTLISPMTDDVGPFMDRDFLLVGVLSAQVNTTYLRFLDTRALQIWRSWARRVPGRVLFFVADGTVLSARVRAARMPVVVLRGVDDSYPPQKKAFSMLRWMFDNQLTKYHWFMRADDDLYVRTDQLKQFLIGQDPDRAHFIGQAGLGNSMEYGQLSLGVQDNYCMGGPGVLLSSETLRQLGPHLEHCLRNLVTTHEDVELGRCVRRHVGIACTWNYEMQTLFHNNASVADQFFSANSLGRDAVLGARALLHPLITLHPVKRAEAMRRVHMHTETLRLAGMRQTRADLVATLAEMRARRGADTATTNDNNGMTKFEDETLDANYVAAEDERTRFSALTPLEHEQPQRNWTRLSVPYWEYISFDAKLLFCAHRPNCPRHTLEAHWRRALTEVTNELFDRFNTDAHNRGRTLHFHRIHYGYTRLRPMYGVDLVLDMALWYRRFRTSRRTVTLATRRHAYVQRRFGPIVSRVVNVMTTDTFDADATLHGPTPIHFVVALKGRSETFGRFAQNLLELNDVLGQNGGGSLELVLVLYSASSADENLRINATIDRLIHSNFVVRVLRMPSGAVFSRGAALSAGAALLSPDALLFVTDVDVLVHPNAIGRIRLNTIRKRQAYFPIVFSEFSPWTWNNISRRVGAVPQQKQQHHQTQSSSRPSFSSHFAYGQRRGYFRHFGYGIMSIFRSDFDTIGQYNRTLMGWGLEDVDLFEKVARSHLLHPFRVPDPGLVHVFHPVDCADGAQNSAQRAACEGTRAQSLASVDFLVEQFSPYL